MKLVCACLIFVRQVQPAFYDNCLQENFPFAMDNLNGNNLGIQTAIYDSTDDRYVYMGGYSGTGIFLAKFEVSSLEFVWIQKMSASGTTAKIVWNLAMHEGNEMLAALTQTDDNNRSLLVLVDRSTGTPSMRARSLKAVDVAVID
jgi:hypothetical protein